MRRGSPLPMKKLMIGIVIVAMIMCVYFMAIPRVSSNDEVILELPKELTLKEVAQKFRAQYGVDYNLINSVIECESHWNPKAKGDNGRALNLAQFHKGTFENWEKQYGEDLNWNSAHDQIKLMAWAFSKGEQYRDDWTTYTAIKRGGTYTFYSKLLQKWFTVKCSMI